MTAPGGSGFFAWFLPAGFFLTANRSLCLLPRSIRREYKPFWVEFRREFFPRKGEAPQSLGFFERFPIRSRFWKNH